MDLNDAMRIVEMSLSPSSRLAMSSEDFLRIAEAQSILAAEYVNAALPAAPMGVKVKPLEWRESPDGNSKKGEVFSARSPVRLYPIAIHKMHGGWWLATNQKTYPRLEAAQAAAFEIERDTILAALTPSPAPTLGDALELPEVQALKAALHRISLGSQDSGTTKESLGREARAALAKLTGGATSERE